MRQKNSGHMQWKSKLMAAQALNQGQPRKRQSELEAAQALDQRHRRALSRPSGRAQWEPRAMQTTPLLWIKKQRRKRQICLLPLISRNHRTDSNEETTTGSTAA